MYGHLERGAGAHPLRLRTLIATAALVAVVALLMAVVPRSQDSAGAQQPIPDGQACYGIADELVPTGGGNNDQDSLAKIDQTNGSNAQILGKVKLADGTPVKQMETAGFGPPLPGSTTPRLFSYNNDVLGTIDLSGPDTDGQYIFTPFPVQAIKGYPFTVVDTQHPEEPPYDITAADEGVDSLAYDVDNEYLVGVVRIEDKQGQVGQVPDQIFIVDPFTGDFVVDAARGINGLPKPVPLPPAGSDFQTANGVPYGDVDDIAINPSGGTVFGILNADGTGGGLARIDPSTGQWTPVARFTDADTGEIVQDLEGLAYSGDRILYGSTGSNGPVGKLDRLWSINEDTAVSKDLGRFPDTAQDYEGLACLTAQPKIDIEKSTNGYLDDKPVGPLLAAGAEITWAYDVFNTGNMPLQNVILTDQDLKTGGATTTIIDTSATPEINLCEESLDTLIGPIAGGGTRVFAPLDNFLCTVKGTVPADNVPLGDADPTNPGAVNQYANLGTVKATYVGPVQTVEVGPETDPSFYFRKNAPTIDIVKTAIAGAGQTCPSFADGVQGLGNPVELQLNDPVTYCLTVKNTGSGVATEVKVVDDNGTPTDTADDKSFDIGTLAAGEEKTVTFDSTSAVIARVENTAVVTGKDSFGTDLTPADDPAVVQYTGTPGLGIVKTVVLGPNGDCAAAGKELIDIPTGSTVTYCIVATNNGDLPLTNVVIDDDYGTPSDTSDDPPTFTIGDLAAGASTAVQKYDRTINEVIEITNTAVVTGQDPSGSSLTDSDQAKVTTKGKPGLEIVKKVVKGPSGNCDASVDRILVDDGDTATFCIYVTNNGNAAANNVVLSDDGGTPDDPADDLTYTIQTIAPGGTELWTFDRVVTKAIVNTACITDPDEDKCDTAKIDITPILQIIKSVVVGADASCADAVQSVQANPGEVVRYCVTVTNVGKGDAINVVVTDDNATIGDTSDDRTFNVGTIKPGESVTLPPYDRTVEGTGPQLITNVATATGQDVDGNEITPVDDDAVVTVPGNVSLTLTKLNVLGPNGNCAAADKFLSTIVGATVTYCVTITNGGTESAFDVVIVDDMTTPNDPSDDYTINVGELSAGETRSYSYDLVVPQGTTSAADLINTATATGKDKDGNEVPGGSAKTTVAVQEPAVGDFTLTKTVLLGNDRDCADAIEGVNELVIDTVGADVTWCITIISNSEGYLGQFEMTDEVLGITPANQPAEITDLVLALNERYTLAVNDTIEAAGVLNTVKVTAHRVNEDNTDAIDPETGQPYPPLELENTAANGEAAILLAKTVLYGADRDCAEAVNLVNDLAVGNVGDPITWCFTATNVGGENLRVTEIADPTLDLVLAVPDANQLLAPAASVTLTAPGEITADMVENIASVEGTIVGTDGNPLTNPETGQPYPPVMDDDPANEGPAILNISKTVLPGADRDCSAATEGTDELVLGEAGDPITWCVTITNTGTVSVTDLMFGDELLNIADAPLSDYLVDAEGLILAPGESVTFPVADTQQSVIAAGGATNTAVVSGVPVNDDGTPIPDAPRITDTNDAANDQIDVDLLKWMVAGHDVDCSTLPTDDQVITGAPGDPISYCFRVTNTGNVDLTVTEIVDATLDITLDIPAEDQVLAPGESYNTSYESTITEGMTENTACVEGTATDPNGNTASTSDCDTAPPPAAQLTDLSIVKTAAQTSVEIGQTVDYTLTITNNGPGEAKNVRVEDLLPAQLTLVNGSVIGEGWDCSASVAKIDCSRPSMLPNTTSSIRFSAIVSSNPVSGNEVTNTSTVSTTTTESDYTNNQDSYTVTIITPIPPKPTPIPPKPTPIPPKPIKPPPPKLAITGADSGELATVGFAAIAAGLGLAVMTRRRRDES